MKLGSVWGPVIRANGRLNLEDDLRSGDLLSCVLQLTSIHTELSNMMVTLGQPRDVECLRKSNLGYWAVHQRAESALVEW